MRACVGKLPDTTTHGVTRTGYRASEKKRGVTDRSLAVTIPSQGSQRGRESASPDVEAV